MALQPSRMSRYLAPLSKVLAVAMLCVNVAYWLNPETTEYTARSMATVPTGQITLTLTVKLLGVLLSSVQVGLLAFALFAVAEVFSVFAKGEWFVASIGQQLHRFGLALALYGATCPLMRTLMALLVTWNNPPGQKLLLIGFNGNDFVLALVGVLILLLGYAMREASRIADENSQII